MVASITKLSMLLMVISLDYILAQRKHLTSLARESVNVHDLYSIHEILSLQYFSILLLFWNVQLTFLEFLIIFRIGSLAQLCDRPIHRLLW